MKNSKRKWKILKKSATQIEKKMVSLHFVEEEEKFKKIMHDKLFQGKKIKMFYLTLHDFIFFSFFK